MNKSARRKIHAAINDLSRGEVATIVRKTHPRVKAGQVDTLAKRVIAAAHRQVSPRKVPPGKTNRKLKHESPHVKTGVWALLSLCYDSPSMR